MATDQERIATLLGQGFSAQAIAAILDTDLTTVHGLSVGSGNLPSAGGGSGLVVGAWEDLAIPADFWLPDNTTFEVAASDVPIEVELQYASGIGANGGFGITGSDASAEPYAFDFNTYGDQAVNVALRTIIPANVPWHVSVFGSMATVGVTQGVASQLRRRTLG